MTPRMPRIEGGAAEPFRAAVIAVMTAAGNRWSVRIGGLLACAVLLICACGGSNPGQPGPAASGAKSSMPVTTTPRPSASTSGLATGTARRLAAAQYLAIALPANRRLDHDFDDGINGPDRNNLTAAEADLRSAAATERRFDRLLLRISLAPPTEAMARDLVAVNQSRARLTDEAAASMSLAQLRTFEPRLKAANVPVEDAVRVIRSELGLPPPETS